MIFKKLLQYVYGCADICRFLNTLLTSAGEMEKRQVELAVKMLDLLKDDGAEEEDDFSNTFYKKKVYSAFNNEDSVIGLVQKLAIKKMAEKGEQVGSKYDEDLVEKLVEDRVRASMMEYKLKQSLEAGNPFTQSNRQRLAAILDTRRHVSNCVNKIFQIDVKNISFKIAF